MSQSESKLSNVRWVTLLLSLAVVLACAGLGGLYYIGVGPMDLAPASRQLDQALSDYRAAGLPWEAKDLKPNPPLTDAQNAAPFLLEAMRLSKDVLSQKKPKEKDLFSLSPDDDAPLIDARLLSLQPALDAAAEAVKSPHVDFNRDYDLGPNLLFPEYSEMKDLVKELGLRAVRRTARRDIDGACADFSAAWKLSELTGDEPILIAVLVQIAQQGIVMADLRAAAAEVADDPQALQKLDALFPRFQKQADFQHSLGFEMYSGISILRNFNLYGGVRGLTRMTSMEDGSLPAPPKLDPNALSRTGLPSGTSARAFLTRHLQYWTQVSKLMTLHKDDPEAMGQDMDDVFNKMNSTPRASMQLEALLMPVFSAAGVAAVRATATVRTTQALVRALIYKDRHGAFPKKIADIPGTWIDPFGGKPLKLVLIGDSIRIYSVGHDRKDEGGKTRAELHNGDSDDVVAVYPDVKGKTR